MKKKKKVPDYENETKRTRNIMLETTTLLEGAGYLFFSSAISYQNFILLRCYFAVKLDKDERSGNILLYRLADRLLLLKCYDIKTVKLPGASL